MKPIDILREAIRNSDKIQLCKPFDDEKCIPEYPPPKQTKPHEVLELGRYENSKLKEEEEKLYDLTMEIKKISKKGRLPTIDKLTIIQEQLSKLRMLDNLRDVHWLRLGYKIQYFRSKIREQEKRRKDRNEDSNSITSL